MSSVPQKFGRAGLTSMLLNGSAVRSSGDQVRGSIDRSWLWSFACGPQSGAEQGRRVVGTKYLGDFKMANAEESTAGRRCYATLVATLLSVIALPGCSWLVERLQGPIAGHEIPIELVTMVTKWPEVQTCIATPGGMCMASARSEMIGVADIGSALDVERGIMHEPAMIAVHALSDPTAAALDSIRGFASQGATQGPDPVHLSRSASRNFAKYLFDATNVSGWTQLSADLASERDRIRPNSSVDGDGAQTLRLTAAIALTTTIGQYLSAYFENGKFVSLTIDPSKAEATAESELQQKLGFSADQAKASVGDVLKQLTRSDVGSDGLYHVITAKGDAGFVTRGGDKYSFPAISITLTPGAGRPVDVTKVDFGSVGADLIRVYLEAVGDTWARLPGVPQATGVTTRLLRSYGTDAAVKEQLDETQFMKVNSLASRAETAAAAGTGQLIRGLGWVSLNNESLAKIIETAAGVAVRKGSEKVAWCIEACGSVVAQAEFDGGKTDLRTIRVSVIE